jgi:hypothetical protein
LTQHRSECLLRLFVGNIVDVLGGLLGNLDSLAALCIEQALDPGQALGARLFPALVSVPAKVASTGFNSFRVKAGILVERDDMGSVRGAEHMTAVAAVMAAQEEAERRTTGGRITVGRGRVRLMY